ncbi:MAG: hypothetical protein HY735_23945 [Verrucomicrobia bacterium]|nr:hypothetical protein [Verrucomicrobiota bacterium]
MNDVTLTNPTERTLKSIFRFLPVLLIAAAAGCSSMGPNSKMGAVTGGAVGAALGGIIGHQSGRALEGAAIGAGIGAVGGGVAGDAVDQKNKAPRR